MKKNKEQNPIELQQGNDNSNEKTAKNKKNFITVIIIIVALVFAGLYLYKQQADAPVMSIDGVEFKLKGKANVLTDAGFELSGDVTTLPSKTWEMSFAVEKNGVSYAYVTLYNDSSSEQPLSECKIGEVTVYKQSFMAYDKFMVNGVKVFDVNAEEIRNEFGIKDVDSVVSTDLGYARVMFSGYDATTDSYGELKIYCDFGKKYD